MKKIEKLFRSYMKVGYDDRTKWRRREEDTMITDHVFVRFSCNGITVNYMYNGTYLFIPSHWFELFGGFYVHSGSQVFYEWVDGEDDYMENIIYSLTKVQEYTMSSLPKISSNFLELLGDICNYGTGGLRKMLKDEYDITISPFEYHSPMKTIRI